MSGLDEIRQRLDAATPGPWTIDDRGSRIIIQNWEYLVAEIDTSYDAPFDREQCEADAEFIAHTREDVGRLLAMLGWTELVCAHGHRWRAEDKSARCPKCGTSTFKESE